MLLSFIKKDPTTRRALKAKLLFKSFGKSSDKEVCLGTPLLQVFRSVDYKLHH